MVVQVVFGDYTQGDKVEGYPLKTEETAGLAWRPVASEQGDIRGAIPATASWGLNGIGPGPRLLPRVVGEDSLVSHLRERPTY